MKPHIKVIQRSGVDIFVTSSMTIKHTASDKRGMARLQGQNERMANNCSRMGTSGGDGTSGLRNSDNALVPSPFQRINPAGVNVIDASYKRTGRFI